MLHSRLRPLPGATAGPPRRTLAAVLVGVVVIIARSLIYLAYPWLHFDSDQATIGLMALRLARLEEFPVFMFGQKYMMAPTAYLAAPIFALTGASIRVLKSVELLFNLVTFVLLFHHLCSEARLRASEALTSCLWLLLPAPLIGSRLLEAAGGNIQPFFFILLLWHWRLRPWLLGVALGVGVLNRDFTWYGMSALAVTELVLQRQPLLSWCRARARTAVAFVAVNTAGIEAARRFTDYRGTRPWTASPTPSHISEYGSFLITHLLPDLFGASANSLRELGVMAPGAAGLPLAAPLVWAVLLLLVLWLARFLWQRGRVGLSSLADHAFPLFLVGVALQSALAFALFVPWAPDDAKVRYILLFLFFPVGVGAMMLQSDAPWVRRPVVLLSVAVSLAFAVGHVTLALDVMAKPPVPGLQELAGALEQRGVRYAVADYWTAYALTFASDEKLRVASRDTIRVREYQEGFREHWREAVHIRAEPCAAETLVMTWEGGFACRAESPDLAPLE